MEIRMSREILFRGKRVDNGKWIYGDLFHRNDELLINNYSQGFNLAIIPSTVGQYTGLTDKNGKKIFEGDILSTGNPDDYYGIVEWDEKNPGLAVSFGGLFEGFEELIFIDKVELEIIGNIYDNPELLEVS